MTTTCPLCHSHPKKNPTDVTASRHDVSGVYQATKGPEMQSTTDNPQPGGLAAFTHEMFGVIRTVEEAGKIHFCGRDVAHALGYTNANKAIQDHCKGVPFRYPLATAGGTQQVRFITEGDLYRLIASSKLPAAEAFESWVFDEVLPSIRQRGGYLTPEAAEAALTDPDFIIRLASDLKSERAKRAELEAKVAQDAPKVGAWDSLISGVGDYTITDAAKVLGRAGVETGPRKLHGQLFDMGWIFKNQRGKWTARQEYLNAGLLAERARYYVSDEGVSTLATPQIRITPKGLQELRQKLAQHDESLEVLA